MITTMGKKRFSVDRASRVIRSHHDCFVTILLYVTKKKISSSSQAVPLLLKDLPFCCCFCGVNNRSYNTIAPRTRDFFRMEYGRWSGVSFSGRTASSFRRRCLFFLFRLSSFFFILYFGGWRWFSRWNIAVSMIG